MFNGIIFNKAKVYKIQKRVKGISLFLKSSIKISKNNSGVSVSCDGTCLTLVSYKKNVLEFYLSYETLNKTKFKNIKLNDEINLELPVKYGQRISGHICQGHVDTTGKIIKIKKVDKSYILDIAINKIFINQLVEKASILINGVSLTVSKITTKGFQIWVIPHTLKLTNLSDLKKGTLINVEIDILSKYVKKYINEK